MDTTASSFTARKNAKRAAEKMIANGTAPAVDYGIEHRSDGRFEIVWKTAPITGEVEAEIATAATGDGHHSTNPRLSINGDPGDAAPKAETDETAAATADEPATLSGWAASATEPENKWPDGTRVMVRKRKSWRKAAIVGRLDADYWRAEYPGGGSGMFEEADIRAYDAERDAKPTQPGRAKATEPKKASRSRYGIDPEAIAAGRLPEKAPVVTSAANPHYQRRFDELHKLAVTGDWAAVRDYKATGSNSYSKLVARYQRDLLALARRCGGRPMNEGGALVRFHDWRAARGRDAPPLALPLHRAGGGACLDWAGHPGAGGRHVILLHPAAHSGAEPRHRPLTYRIIKEICNAARELARFPAPFFSVLPDLFVAGDDTHEIHSLAPGVATSAGRSGRGRVARWG
jgi:hypothetical protein